MIYDGYVYMWFDTKADFSYIGGHFGKVEDSYICSSKTMLRAFKIRPETFQMKVLEYVQGSKVDLRNAEQRWLDTIDQSEFMTSENIKNGTCRYYNVKPTAAGGNGNANKGNTKLGGHNKGITNEHRKLREEGLLCFLTDKPKIPVKKVSKQKIAKVSKFKRAVRSYPLITKCCTNCGTNYDTKTGPNEKKFCSRSCAGSVNSKRMWAEGKATKNPGRPAWNKGLSNPISSENGRKSAKKQSETVTGRRKTVREDGTWFWSYPEK